MVHNPYGRGNTRKPDADYVTYQRMLIVGTIVMGIMGVIIYLW